jgi:hypothetical protein
MRPWYGRASFRMAAGIAGAALVGVIGFRAMEQSSQGTPVPAGDVGRLATERQAIGRSFEKAQANAPEAARMASADELGVENERGKRKDPDGSYGYTPAIVAASSAERRNGDEANALAGASGAPRAGLTVESLELMDRKIDLTPTQGPQGGVAVLHAEADRSQATSAQDKPVEFVATALGRTAPSAPSLGSEAATTSGLDGTGKPWAFGGRKLGAGPRKGRAGGAPRSSDGSSQRDSFYLGQGAAPASSPPAAKDELSLEVAARFVRLGYTGEGEVFGGDREALRGLGYTGEDDGDDFRFRRGADARDVLDRIRSLSPEDREQWLDLECRRILERCRRRPNERPRDMFFRFYGDNPFELTALDALSTFSVDVDTASYTLARRYLNDGHLPEKAQVRTEEFVNYFRADVPAPTSGTFAIHTDLAPSRFSADRARSMLRVVVRGKDVAKEERQPLNITFVIDTSGSMKQQNRHELVTRPPGEREALVTRDDVVGLYQEIVDGLNQELSPHERIKRFALLPREFSIDSGELTPTLKVKRKVVEEKWREVIEALYRG